MITVQVLTSKDLGISLSRLNAEMRARAIRALDAAGLIVQNAAKKSITSGPKTGRTYRRGTVLRRASAPGEAPANQTATLLGSIQYQVSEQELMVQIVAGVAYAKFLELGTRKMAPRPFMNPALTNNRPKIIRAMRAALSTPIGGNGVRRR
jgi:HK97 gp10 family phage protein